MAAGVGILFVDGGGEHADRAQEELAIFFGGLLEAFDVLLDVAGHLIESFGQLADFRGAFDLHALVKFSAADGARGFDQAADGASDAEGEKISEQSATNITPTTKRKACAVSSFTPASMRAHRGCAARSPPNAVRGWCCRCRSFPRGGHFCRAR